jgi:hypothetical protein
MLKVVFSALAAVVMVTAVGVTGADAKAKAKAKAKEASTASCINNASGLMRDDSKFHMCHPVKR